MRISLILLILLSIGGTASQAANSDEIALKEALKAYEESRALGHKADTFLHAQRALSIARVLFPDEPGALAPILHLYARAAVRYREPVALITFKETLTTYENAFGAADSRLAGPLVDAAEEAMLRKEPRMAYEWYRRAEILLTNENVSEGILLARQKTGMARMYTDSGELDRAETLARDAVALVLNFSEPSDYITDAELHYYLGDVMRRLSHHPAARDLYTYAIEIYQQHEPRSRKLLSAHRRLVEVYHEIGDQAALIQHCHAVERYQNARNLSEYYPLYDPAGVISGFGTPGRVGEMVVSFYVGANCRPNDITIHGAVGIELERAEAILAATYFTPEFVNGEPQERVQELLQLSIHDN